MWLSNTALKTTNEATSASTSKFTIIRANNYDKFQEATSTLTNERQTSDKQATNKRQQRKNDKKNKECKEDKESDQLLPPWAAEKGWTPEYYEEWNDQ